MFTRYYEFFYRAYWCGGFFMLSTATMS